MEEIKGFMSNYQVYGLEDYSDDTSDTEEILPPWGAEKVPEPDFSLKFPE